MRKIIIILLLLSVKAFSQYTEEKLSRIVINKHEIDTIQKKGHASIYAYFHNELTHTEIAELSEIIGEYQLHNRYTFELNFQITKEGRIRFIKNDLKAKKSFVAEELRGLPQFEKTYYDKQEFIDFINHYFERKRYIFQLFSKHDKNIPLDLSNYLDYTFHSTFIFTAIKHYPKIIDNTRKKRKS